LKRNGWNERAFYVLDGKLTFQLDDQATAAGTGELIFAPRGVPHTLANLTEAPARYLLVLIPPGFEREFARRAANQAGIKPPDRALQPIPEVTYLGAKIGRQQAP
jgi:mannose-6-phosphate isomerase-like protein (cupin superfamily)